MTQISIGTAWEETLAFVKREGTLLFPVALVFLALPAVVLQLLAPDELRTAGMVEEATNAPQLPPGFLFAMLVVLLISMIGILAVNALALRPGISVAEALQLALKRMPVLMGAAILLILGFLGVLLILSIVGGGLSAAMGMGPAMSLVILLATPIMLFVTVRLILLNAVIIDIPVGPKEAIRQGWQLTVGQFWRLLAFIIVLIMLMIVIQLVSRSLFGIAGTLIGGTTLATLLAGLAVAVVNAVLQVYYLVMTCRIYRQLTS
ncbi:hypothetical protein [Rhizorhapis suberifaciens]|uniref:Glycerophosphoryl diester phosphodiesterase membrane domain-containing protein n=1 Tax=Rhizorhapis suberifaciens TaxID=13656 RepID=A0A840HRB7_9SPHN|nr:hypothetical protein [Rhizorhapis suberifaciens]MBB4640251.1 hypothetical protein [Rhizorhapis suberifaciens]